MTRSNGVQVIIDKLHTGRFEQHYLDHFLWYNNTPGKKEEEKKEDEDQVSIIQEYLCIMLVSFILDVHGLPLCCSLCTGGDTEVW